jgi:hypothetical protein
MQLFSLISILFLSFSLKAQSFNTKSCLNHSFKESLEHSGKFFGYPKHLFSLEKKSCTITMTYKTIFEKSWTVDVCREPIHIKQRDKGSLVVIKRKKSCAEAPGSEFCQETAQVLELLQDHGLIFASGVKEDLKTPLGKIYCSYLLLQQYLVEGNVFSLYKDNKPILDMVKESENCVLPKRKETQVKGPDVNLVPKRVPIPEKVQEETTSKESESDSAEDTPKF